jgi:hypothetical protein
MQGTFTEWLNVPMTRTKGTHVFTVTLNVPLGTHYYCFVENGKKKNDPKKPTGARPCVSFLLMMELSFLF